MRFYLIIPVMFMISKRVYIIASVVFYLIDWVLYPYNTAEVGILGNFLFNFNIFFVVGISLYDNFATVHHWLTTNYYIFFTLALFLVGVMVMVKFFLLEGNKITPIIAAILALLSIVNFLHYKINNRILKLLGTLSYTIYVSHYAGIFLFKLILLGLSSRELQIMSSQYLRKVSSAG